MLDNKAWLSGLPRLYVLWRACVRHTGSHKRRSADIGYTSQSLATLAARHRGRRFPTNNTITKTQREPAPPPTSLCVHIGRCIVAVRSSPGPVTGRYMYIYIIYIYRIIKLHIYFGSFKVGQKQKWYSKHQPVCLTSQPPLNAILPHLQLSPSHCCILTSQLISQFNSTSNFHQLPVSQPPSHHRPHRPLPRNFTHLQAFHPASSPRLPYLLASPTSKASIASQSPSPLSPFSLHSYGLSTSFMSCVVK